jgi:hypothetical protein
LVFSKFATRRSHIQVALTLLSDVDQSKDANLKRDSEVQMVSIHLASSLIQGLAAQPFSYTRDLESG